MATPVAFFLFSRLPNAEVVDCVLKHKEKARESKPCLSHRLGSRIAYLSRINNADAHASNILMNGISETMNVKHCFTVR